jgi:hypothetical protein
VIGPLCPGCGFVGHPTVVAGSRFKRPLDGYRAASGGPVRATRSEAELDACEQRIRNEQEGI